jgi:hypothetical protein
MAALDRMRLPSESPAALPRISQKLVNFSPCQSLEGHECLAVRLIEEMTKPNVNCDCIEVGDPQ